ncbi:MAG TPA: hypothetical protein ENN99_05850, partial [Chloroflexi bacterium]|nr:hypothetical protein [Chloroflexota bacterium]
MTDLYDAFITAFGVWEAARPYVHLMVAADEMALVVALAAAGEPLTVGEIAGRLALPPETAAELVQRCYARHIVNRSVEPAETDDARYTAADFYARLDHFAKFEGWDDIPAADRQIIERSYLDQFIARHRRNVARKMAGLEAENALPNDTILLLHEVAEMLDAAADIIVQPCDCRRLAQQCDRPVETCIWLDEGARHALARGYGRRLSREEAKELVRQADRQGLMHTADSEWQTRGLHAICNCCACDCYPFRAAQELGSKGVWPKSRYVAAHDRTRCTFCGLCVRRCHFDAFYHDGATVEVNGKAKGNDKENVQFDPE